MSDDFNRISNSLSILPVLCVDDDDGGGGGGDVVVGRCGMLQNDARESNRVQNCWRPEQPHLTDERYFLILLLKMMMMLDSSQHLIDT